MHPRRAGGCAQATPACAARRRAVLSALALGLAWPMGGAFAHALVVASEPAAGAVLAAAPARVAVRFNSRIDPLRSRLALVPAEARTGAAPVTLEIAPGSEPTVVEAPCPPLAPGPWRLRWQVLAVDGHITRGDIPFTVAPAAAAPAR